MATSPIGRRSPLTQNRGYVNNRHTRPARLVRQVRHRCDGYQQLHTRGHPRRNGECVHVGLPGATPDFYFHQPQSENAEQDPGRRTLCSKHPVPGHATACPAFRWAPDDTLTNLFQERHGLPNLRGATAILVADVDCDVEAGDHVLLLGHVRHLHHDPATARLVYHATEFGSLTTHPAG